MHQPVGLHRQRQTILHMKALVHSRKQEEVMVLELELGQLHNLGQVLGRLRNLGQGLLV